MVTRPSHFHLVAVGSIARLSIQEHEMANSDLEASRSLAMDLGNMRGLLQRRLVIPERSSPDLRSTTFNNQVVGNSLLRQATVKVDLFPHLPTRKNLLSPKLRLRIVQTRFG